MRTRALPRQLRRATRLSIPTIALLAMMMLPTSGSAQRTICETTTTEKITRYYLFGYEVFSITETTTTTTCIYHNN